ncbi:pilus assembly protein N-terminal domain-containing protein [Bosea beijingensis]|uniref:pilus assembly protein N-terminal domain-containing protein n=1 Tax=Bosea beijingensis TaxID=3068632 RepID=UPI002741A476|nr:pilus assembly protein N-terminal domain-containing protein [Bosea sp. REN20]
MLIIRAPEGRRRLTHWVAATALAITVGGTAIAASPRAKSESVIVLVDHAKVVRLPEKAQTVIVGNPAIADVAVQRNGVMIVTGKSFGVTNLIALDASGTLLAESMVRVSADSDAVLTVQRGMNRESYACNPDCQPSVQLGDTPDHFTGAAGQAAARNALATGSGRN